MNENTIYETIEIQMIVIEWSKRPRHKSEWLCRGNTIFASEEIERRRHIEILDQVLHREIWLSLASQGLNVIREVHMIQKMEWNSGNMRRWISRQCRFWFSVVGNPIPVRMVASRGCDQSRGRNYWAETELIPIRPRRDVSHQHLYSLKFTFYCCCIVQNWFVVLYCFI